MKEKDEKVVIGTDLAQILRKQWSEEREVRDRGGIHRVTFAKVKEADAEEVESGNVDDPGGDAG